MNEDVQLLSSVECQGCKWVSFHPHSTLILSCDLEKTLKIWSITDNNIILKKNVQDEHFHMQCVEVHPRTHHIVSCSIDGCFKVRTDDGKCIDNYFTKDEWQNKLDCHTSLQLVALGTEKALIILALNKAKF